MLAIVLADLAAAPIDGGRVKSLVFPAARLDEIRALGPAVLPVLASLYERSGEPERAAIASVFYALGWKSSEAKRVLLRDLQTPNESLRLQAQVRDIALKALVIHTGQTNGFNPSGSDEERDAAVAEWRRWLERYRSGM